MMTRSIKPILPRSLFGRSILILIVPIILVQIVVGTIFVDRLFRDVTVQMTTFAAQEIDFVIGQIEGHEFGRGDSPDPLRLSAFATPFGISTPRNPSEGRCSSTDSKLLWDVTGRHVIDVLRQEIPAVQAVDLTSNKREVRLCASTSAGTIEFTVPRAKVSARNPHQLLVAMVLASLLFTAISILFLRNQINPITGLARAAESFGMGHSVPFRPRGALEVRRAGSAFLTMRDRIERHIEQRTIMLSGVSHDLRTPLTRIKLSLSLMPEDEETRLIRRDVSEMEKTLDEFLAFASDAAGEEVKPIIVKQLAIDLVGNRKRSGDDVDLRIMTSVDDQVVTNARRAALARAIDNLLSNACHHGSSVRLSVDVRNEMVAFIVEDDGPGIPPSQRQSVFLPFLRLDDARNQDKGTGIGLGLTISKDVAEAHGGTVELGTSENLGGLKAVLSVPRTPDILPRADQSSG